MRKPAWGSDLGVFFFFFFGHEIVWFLLPLFFFFFFRTWDRDFEMSRLFLVLFLVSDPLWVPVLNATSALSLAYTFLFPGLTVYPQRLKSSAAACWGFTRSLGERRRWVVWAG